jgi:hypothetical protein
LEQSGVIEIVFRGSFWITLVSVHHGQSKTHEKACLVLFVTIQDPGGDHVVGLYLFDSCQRRALLHNTVRVEAFGNVPGPWTISAPLVKVGSGASASDQRRHQGCGILRWVLCSIQSLFCAPFSPNSPNFSLYKAPSGIVGSVEQPDLGYHDVDPHLRL